VETIKKPSNFMGIVAVHRHEPDTIRNHGALVKNTSAVQTLSHHLGGNVDASESQGLNP
jgi:hypothetical protein